jgi:hypothetical protein
VQLPWQHVEARGAGGAETTATPAPSTRTRRWRRIIARPVVAPAAEPAPPATAADAAAAAAAAARAVAPREPGFVAVAIARILIAIDFALGGRR